MRTLILGPLQGEKGVGGEVAIDLLKLSFEREQGKAGNAQYGRRSSFSALRREVSNSKSRGRLLAPKIDREEPLGGLKDIGGVAFERVGGCNSDSGGETLRVTSSTRDARSVFAGPKVRKADDGEVLDKLGETDERKGYGDGDKVIKRTFAGSIEPRYDMEAVGVAWVAIQVRLFSEWLEHVLRDARD